MLRGKSGANRVFRQKISGNKAWRGEGRSLDQIVRCCLWGSVRVCAPRLGVRCQSGIRSRVCQVNGRPYKVSQVAGQGPGQQRGILSVPWAESACLKGRKWREEHWHCRCYSLKVVVPKREERHTSGRQGTCSQQQAAGAGSYVWQFPLLEKQVGKIRTLCLYCVPRLAPHSVW